MSPNEIKSLIQPYLESKDIINIETEDDVHFNILIVSNKFYTMTLINRQKMISKILESFILSGKIHAIKFNLFTPDEYNNMK